MTAALADPFRSKLVTATREGGAFDIETGLPVSMLPARSSGPTWYQHALDFVDAKWSTSSARHRHSTAEGLTTVTLALCDGEPPDPAVARSALARWAFNAAIRKEQPEPPDRYYEAITWVRRHSRPLNDLNDPTTVRAVLTAWGTLLDGSPAAPATMNRKRAALSAAISYAVERGDLPASPLPKVKMRRKRTRAAIDSRVVVNHDQAKALFEVIRERYPAFHAAFAVIYYAGLRPAEVRNLRAENLSLPRGNGWGQITLRNSYQDAGKDWTDTGTLGEERELKHRAEGDARPVPAAPQLVAVLKHHLATYGPGPGGYLFLARVGQYGPAIPAIDARPITEKALSRMLQHARVAAFTSEQIASPLARRPYDLRHACVSTWLAAGVAPAQVAAWAGHSVAVLLKVYAHALDGQTAQAQQRIQQLLDAPSGHGLDRS